MRMLLVKLSSLGDVVHTLPALTDAARACPSLEVDWVVEEAFRNIVELHPAVAEVIPIALRRWRGALAASAAEVVASIRQLRSVRYDVVLDAQGLIKSALVTRLARGRRVGFDVDSLRERAACAAYTGHIYVPKRQHAIARQRELFAAALQYALPAGAVDYGLSVQRRDARGLLLLHGTTWSNKSWPDMFWIELAKFVLAHDVPVTLPWGNADEHDRARRIAAQARGAVVAPPLDLRGMIDLLAASAAVVTVDSGLGHLAAALNVPTAALYGPTDPALTGCIGAAAVNLAADFGCAPCLERRCGYRGPTVVAGDRAVQPPCFSTVTPDRVWRQVAPWLNVR